MKILFILLLLLNINLFAQLSIDGGNIISNTTSIEINEKISHKGDDNTYIRLTADQIDFYAGTLWLLSLDEGSQDKVVINPNSSNVDFVVKGDTRSIIYVDGNGEYIQFPAGVSYVPLKKTSAYIVTYSDNLILCDGTFTLELSQIGIDGQLIIIKNTGTGIITIDGKDAQTIDGQLTQVLNNQYDTISIVGSKSLPEMWLIIADNR